MFLNGNGEHKFTGDWASQPRHGCSALDSNQDDEDMQDLVIPIDEQLQEAQNEWDSLGTFCLASQYTVPGGLGTSEMNEWSTSSHVIGIQPSQKSLGKRRAQPDEPQQLDTTEDIQEGQNLHIQVENRHEARLKNQNKILLKKNERLWEEVSRLKQAAEEQEATQRKFFAEFTAMQENMHILLNARQPTATNTVVAQVAQVSATGNPPSPRSQQTVTLPPDTMVSHEDSAFHGNITMNIDSDPALPMPNTSAPSPIPNASAPPPTTIMNIDSNPAPHAPDISEPAATSSSNHSSSTNMNVDSAPSRDYSGNLFPTGSSRTFTGQLRSAQPRQSQHNTQQCLYRPDPLISRNGLEPETTWTPIALTPFSEGNLGTCCDPMRKSRRPVPRITSFTEHCRAIAGSEFVSRLPPEDRTNEAAHIVGFDELPEQYFTNFRDPEEMKEMIKIMQIAVDQNLRVAFGGLGAAAARSRNPYQHTPYGMPTGPNKHTLNASRLRYRALINNHPKWEANAWNEKVRAVFFHFLRISSVKEVRFRAPVPNETRLLWEANTGPEPSLMKLQFDWLGGTASAWNVKVLRMILEFLRMEWQRLKNEWNLLWYCDEHFVMKISNLFNSLKREWKAGQPKPGESLTDCVKRLEADDQVREKRAREGVRRIQKYKRREYITASCIQSRSRALEEKRAEVHIFSDEMRALEEDLRVWKMASSVITRLGPSGMSSDDSDTEDDGTVIYRVKIVVWRRRMEALLRLIDRQRLDDPSIFTQRGAKPGRRIRKPEGTLESGWQWKTRRIHPEGLPEALYDPEWLQQIMGDTAFLTLHVSKEEFDYFEIVSQAENWSRFTHEL